MTKFNKRLANSRLPICAATVLIGVKCEQSLVTQKTWAFKPNRIPVCSTAGEKSAISIR